MTNRGQSSIKFAGPKAWAEVPKHIKEVAFRKPFSKKLKAHILSEIYEEMPPKTRSNNDSDIAHHNTLENIFLSDDEDNEFLGFDEVDNTALEIISLQGNINNNVRSTDIIDLNDIFQSDSENSDDEFFGFINE